MNINRRIAAALLGMALLSLACGSGKPKVEAEAAGALDYPRGPHGARLLTGADLQMEVTIFETGVEPHFRIYPLDGAGKPIAPREVQLLIELHRLGGRVDKVAFEPEADYLRGTSVVDEPHSFDVKVKATRNGRTVDWSYSQIEGKVQLSDEVLKSTGIEIREVGSREMTTSLELPGEILADETRVAQVVARMPGIVARVLKAEGDAVDQGEVLAIIESRDLAEARSGYLAAAQRAAFLNQALEREEGLFKKRISPENDVLEARRALEEGRLAERLAAQKLVALGESQGALAQLQAQPPDRLPRFELRAPFKGRVTERDLTAGESVTADHKAFVVADLSTVWVQGQIPARDLPGIRRGQEARIQSKDLTGEARGRLTYLSDSVSVDTRSATARLSIPNPRGNWRPGLFVTVSLTKERSEAKLAVPQEAIQTFRDWQVVFVRYGDWFEARPLELGRTDSGWVEVLSGLSPGEKYAATNSFAIKAEIGKLGATHDH